MDVRARLTNRITRTRLELEAKRAVPPLVVIAIAGVIGLLAWGYQIAQIGQDVLKGSREVRFQVDDATAIVAGGDEVRFKGIPAGRITGLETVNGRPVVTAKIDRDFGPIYRDARATLRPNTALEDMYIDVVDRGTQEAGVASKRRPVPADRTAVSVQAEEVLQVFNPATRGRLAALLRDLGGGLRDHGAALQDAFVKAVPFLEVTARLTDQLAARSRQTRRLVHNFGALTDELGRRQRELRTLTRQGGGALRSLADASPDLDATLRELPPTLAGTRASFATVRAVLPAVDGALTDLGGVAERLPAGLRALRRFSADAGPAVDALQEPVSRLLPLVRQLVPLAGSLSQTVSALRPQTNAIAHVLDASARCAYPAVAGFMENTASLTKFEDARGVFPRGDAVVSIASTGVVGDPNQRPLKGCAGGTTKRGEP